MHLMSMINHGGDGSMNREEQSKGAGYAGGVTVDSCGMTIKEQAAATADPCGMTTKGQTTATAEATATATAMQRRMFTGRICGGG
jgi:hypothetical protein